jgi:hypothetical protein
MPWPTDQVSPGFKDLVFYGSSLFVNAIAASFEKMDGFRIIHLLDDDSLTKIAELNPTALIWHQKDSDLQIPDVLNPGLILIEINEEKSLITVQKHPLPTQQQFPVRDAKELTERISQCILPGCLS